MQRIEYFYLLKNVDILHHGNGKFRKSKDLIKHEINIYLYTNLTINNFSDEKIFIIFALDNQKSGI